MTVRHSMRKCLPKNWKDRTFVLCVLGKRTLECIMQPIIVSTTAVCAHGGAFWEAINPDFTRLDRKDEVINADVLDAWFPPAPGVAEALSTHLPWLLQTSPPTESEGLRQAISAARQVPVESLAVGAGSSSLMYLALRTWLTPQSRVLLPDPTYGEYAHLFENVIGCRVDRADVDPERILTKLSVQDYDLLVLVNPNNPTGEFWSRATMQTLLDKIPQHTRVWVDEAYIDYVGYEHSIETLAFHSANIIVCKSLSKGYALSGARAAYLCGPPNLMQEIRHLTPPWAVSLLAQVATVAALADPGYYQTRYAETHVLRNGLQEMLTAAFPEWEIVASPANWLRCRLPPSGPDAATLCCLCRGENVFLRDLSALGPKLGSYTLRIAVKEVSQNQRIVETLAYVTREGRELQYFSDTAQPGRETTGADFFEGEGPIAHR